MLEQNRAELEKLGVLWWKERYKSKTNGKDFKIAVVDKGCPRERQKDYVEFPIDYTDEVAHGANVSECVALVVHEVFPEAKIVLLPHNSSGIQYILDNDIKIVNSSVGNGGSCPFFEPLKDKALVFGASGNGFNEDGVYYPGAYPWNIAVGAFENAMNKPASYSNGGPELDICSYTNLAVETDSGSVFEFNGTSAASPDAAATMAIAHFTCLELGIDLTPKQMQQYVIDNAEDVYKPGYDTKTGWGLFKLPQRLPKKLQFKIGCTDYISNGDVKVMDTTPVIKNNRLLLPSRVIAEELGCSVTYDKDLIYEVEIISL